MEAVTHEAGTQAKIACSLSATEQKERGHAFDSLLTKADGLRELPEGWALRFPNDDNWILRAVALVIAERKCCPFFGFTFVFEPNDGPVWLHFEGPEPVKAMIREQFVPSHLRAAV
jgi:hypothetical protein